MNSKVIGLVGTFGLMIYVTGMFKSSRQATRLRNISRGIALFLLVSDVK